MTLKCPHDFLDKQTAVECDGLCPLCLIEEIRELRNKLDDMEIKIDHLYKNLSPYITD